MAKKRRYKKKKNRASKMDVTVISLIILSILLAVLIYTKSGVIGVKLNDILGGMVGLVQYVLPIGVFVIAIKLASEGSEDLTPKWIQYGVLLVSLSIVFSVFQISSSELQINKELSEVVKDAYFLGSQGKGGGAIRSLWSSTSYKIVRRDWCYYSLLGNCYHISSVYIRNKFIRMDSTTS